MLEVGSAGILGSVIAANVTIAVGAFTLIRKVLSTQNSSSIPKDTRAANADVCITRILSFMDNTEKILTEANRIQHTQTRYIDDLRQELSQLRTEVSEVKGMLH